MMSLGRFLGTSAKKAKWHRWDERGSIPLRSIMENLLSGLLVIGVLQIIAATLLLVSTFWPKPEEIEPERETFDWRSEGF